MINWERNRIRLCTVHSCEKKLRNTTQAEHAQTQGCIRPKRFLITAVVSHQYTVIIFRFTKSMA